MLSRIFTVDQVTLTSTGTAVSSYLPFDQTTRKLPTQVVVKATGQGAYVRLSDDQSAATNADVLVQAGDHVVLAVAGRHWVSVLSDGASSTVNIGALSTGVWGDAATLNLNFISGTLDSRIAFTRASTATYVNANGLITSAANNVQRFDYNPTTGAANGLLIEESRQNLLLQSSMFTTSWTPSANLTYSRTLSAPDDTSTATSVIENTATAARFTQQTVTSTGSNTHTLTIYAKITGTGSQRWLGLRFSNDASPSTNYVQAVFDINAGTAGSLVAFGDATATSATIVNAGNGWYRATLVGIPSSSATSVQVRVGVSNTSTNFAPSYLGDGVSGLILWGAQLEVGAFPTSYIPTTTTALTRAADSAVINTLSPWFNASEGTLLAEYSIPYLYTTAPSNAASISDGTTNNEFAIRTSTSHTLFANQATVAGFTVTNLGNIAFGTFPAAGAVAKQALAIKSGDSAYTAQGAAATSVATTFTPPAMNVLRLGTASIQNNVLNGYLRRVTYYPRRLSQTELQTITT